MGLIMRSWQSMGLADRLVGRTKADTQPPEILAKPSIGTHMRPNVEMILGLKPDLIIQDAGASGGHAGIGPVTAAGCAGGGVSPHEL